VRNARLEDGDIAVLARQALNLLDPEAEIDIVPQPSADPYRWGGLAGAWLVWPRLDGRRRFAIRVTSDLSPAGALAHLIDGLAQNLSDSALFRGADFPPCPGHEHPAELGTDGDDVVLRCPDTADEVGRIRPALPA